MYYLSSCRFLLNLELRLCIKIRCCFTNKVPLMRLWSSKFQLHCSFLFTRSTQHRRPRGDCQRRESGVDMLRPWQLPRHDSGDPVAVHRLPARPGVLHRLPGGEQHGGALEHPHLRTQTHAQRTAPGLQGLLPQHHTGLREARLSGRQV